MQPYTPSPAGEPGSRIDRDADMKEIWGRLPDKLRDELSQADDDFRSVQGQYREKLLEYSKIISQE